MPVAALVLYHLLMLLALVLVRPELPLPVFVMLAALVAMGSASLDQATRMSSKAK